MNFGLQDKVALVTGGARGIGLAEGGALAAEGAQLAIVDLDLAAAQEAAAGLAAGGVRAEAYQGDAAEEGDVARTVQAVLRDFGRLDILVNNAGIGVKPAYPVQSMPAEAWDTMVHVHMRSTFLWS